MDIRRKYLRGINIPGALLLLLIVNFGASADQTGDTLNVKIHGTLRRMPCVINNDKAIVIDFGNVGVNKVNGDNYKQSIDYLLECKDPDATANLNMTLRGVQSSYNTGAINTNVPGLGIEILQNGSPVTINKAFVIDYNNPPRLEAVPVSSGVPLTEGAFNATATLMAEYE
uniref:fimbrial protein n=1 Tax=Pantoea sp. IMH TaxID=1267600 RepID=UPI0004690D7C|nr:fimbrial protein [Pantoea sp. IMH]